MCKEFLWDVSWELQTTRSQAVPNPGSMECVEQLKIWCSFYWHWSGSTSVGSGIIMLKKHWLFSNKHDLLVISASLGSLSKSRSWFLYLWPCTMVNNACVVPENCEHAFSSRRLSLGVFLSRMSGVTIFKWLAFQFRVIMMHPTLFLYDNAEQKIITLAFIARD